LGPETTSEFYLNLIKKSRKYCSAYPSILIDNISFPFCLEKEIISDSRNEEKLLPILKESMLRLNRAGADLIAIPCNTVHIFIEELRRVSHAPIISIIDETVKYAKQRNYKKLGLLATTKTIQYKLYQKPLVENGIKVILPREQKKISEIIVRILRNSTEKSDKIFLNNIIKKLEQNGCEAVVLGCTDLQLLLKQEKYSIELLDTLEILAQSVFEKIRGDKNG